MTLEEVLNQFNSEDVADALFQASLPVAGTKSDRVAKLVAVASETHAQALFELFTVGALRVAADRLAIRGSRKGDLVDALVAVLPEGSTANPPPPPEVLAPTLKAVIDCLRRVDIPSRKAKIEADADNAIADALGPSFAAVAIQYNVGGYLGHRIDLDIGNGQVGIEIKLADSLLKNTGEIHRLIGQSVYYSRKRYGKNLVVVVVGRRGDSEDPLFLEMAQFLSELGITSVFLPTS